MTRSSTLAVVLLVAELHGQVVTDYRAQAKTQGRAPLSFEIATIKPAPPGKQGGAMMPHPGGQVYEVYASTLKLMIRVTYRITDQQIVGGEDWVDKERWDILAKAEHPATGPQRGEMVQTLLATRFNLKYHIEKRNLPALALTVYKPGKLLVNTNTNLRDGDWLPIRMTSPLGGFKGERATMSYFTWWFASNILKQPIVDRTGLQDFYDFDLHFNLAALNSTQDENADTPAGPSLFTALKEQMGLKLSRIKGPVEVIVIDHADRPSAN
jgi:uncharacterized protein (TIGR03435 family)